MIWESTGTLYTTFTECSTAIIQNAATTGNSAAGKAMIISWNGVFSVLTYFESKY